MAKFSDLAADYKTLWDNCAIRPERAAAVAGAAQKLRSLKANYDAVSVGANVPWYVVGIIHSLEATFALNKHLHNGDPLTATTVRVPKGHPKNSEPPFTWTASAIDALNLKGLQNVGKDQWSVERIAFELERYNGFGYRKNHPSVKSPYLWSFTDRYTKGKYVKDGEFDPSAVSAQVGGMALLKQLLSDEAIQVQGQASLPPPPPPSPPVPVPTGMFLPDTLPFNLRAKPEQAAEHILFVDTDVPVQKLQDDVDPWLKVEVIASDASKHVGFARRDWLKPQTVLSRFDMDEFAQACLDFARRYGVNAHFLLALADAETGIKNEAVHGAANAFGPFALTLDDWRNNNNFSETGFHDHDRFDPIAQVAIAARLVVKLTQATRESLPDESLPNSIELYLARLFGPENVGKLIDPAAAAKTLSKVLPASVDVAAVATQRPSLFVPGVKVKDLRDAIAKKLTTAFEIAASAILKVEPDLMVGPPTSNGDLGAASGDVGEVPWMAKAREELAKDIKEDPVNSNPQIEKYFVETTLGKRSDDVAWCAAFVSWCIKTSGGAHMPIIFSARAADWLKNGKAIPGPEFGAVAVTRPLAKGASGHVGFVVSWDGATVTLLGGNQGDAVSEKEFHIADVRGWRMT